MEKETLDFPLLFQIFNYILPHWPYRPDGAGYSLTSEIRIFFFQILYFVLLFGAYAVTVLFAAFRCAICHKITFYQ